MPTLKDVAKAAGTSVMTVSRVINSPERVQPATRKAVEQAIQEVGYIRNSAARALANNRLGVIDVYIPEHIDLFNTFAMHLIAGISDVLSRHLYSFLILRSREQQHPCDGYIVMGLFKNETSQMLDFASRRNCPMVLFGHTDLPDVDCIDVDNVEGQKEVVKHLLALGHRHIAMLNVDEEKDFTQDRLNGYQDALMEAELPLRREWVCFTQNNENAGFEAARSMLLAYPQVTALTCASDVLALGAIRAVKDMGRSVPEDISITGFDGLGYQLFTDPKIFTVQQPVYDIGQELAAVLLRRLNGENFGVIKKLVSPTLLFEGSVAAPRLSVTI